MKSKILIPVSLCLGALVVSVPVFAHHSSFAFDNESTLIIKGRVTEWFWANPHCLLKLDVTTDSGEVVRWVTETQAPANMIDAGWRKSDLKPGDEVNPRRVDVSVPDSWEEKAGKELSAAVERFLRDASKAPPWESSGIIWAEMCARLNEALVCYRKGKNNVEDRS